MTAGAVVMMSIVLSIVTLGCSQAKSLAPIVQEKKPTSDLWSVGDHMVAAQGYEQRAEQLESELIKLKERAEMFTRKPYLDPKGFRRDSLKRSMGMRKIKIRELHKKYRWHLTEASRLSTIEQSDSTNKEKSDTGSISKNELQQLPPPI